MCYIYTMEGPGEVVVVGFLQTIKSLNSDIWYRTCVPV